MEKEYSMAQDFSNNSTLGAVTSVCLFIVSKIFLLLGINGIADVAAFVSILAAAFSMIVNYPKLKEWITIIIKKYL